MPRLLHCLILCLASFSPIAALALVPGMNDAVVATEAGFVAFTHEGVHFSSDGKEFAKVHAFTPSPEFKAVAIRNGIAAVHRNRLWRFDSRGQPLGEAPGTGSVTDIAGDGQTAVALGRDGTALLWTGAEWSLNYLTDGAQPELIGRAFGRWWIAGAQSIGEEDESDAALWSSSDGRTWERVKLPDYPADLLPDRSFGPASFRRFAAIPGCILAADPFATAVVSRDGRTWRWISAAPKEQATDVRFFAEFSRIQRNSYRRDTLIDESITIDGEKWAPLPPNAHWSAWREIPGPRGVMVKAEPKAGGPPVIVDLATFRAPAAFLSNLASERAALVAAAEQKKQAEAAEKLLAEQRAAEAKALAQKKAEREAAAAKALAAKEAEEKRLQPAAIALAQFEQAILDTQQLDQLGEPLAKLVKALDAAGANQLADAASDYAIDYLYRFGGARGYFTYMMTVPDKRLGSAMNRVEAPRKPLIRAFGAAYRAGQGLANTAEVRQAEAAWPPGTRNPNSTGPQQPKTDRFFDLAKLRLAVLRGRTGATHDLATIYVQGYGARKDTLLASFWFSLFNHFHPGKPDAKQGEDAVRAFLVKSGVPSFVSTAAIAAFKANHFRYTEESFSAFERSGEDGDLVANQYLAATPDTVALRREGMPFAQIYGYSADRFANFDAKSKELTAQGLNYTQIIRYVDQSVSYTARAMTTDTTKSVDTPVGRAYAAHLKASEAERGKMYADLAAKDKAASQSERPNTMTVAGRKIDLAAQMEQAADNYSSKLDTDIASGKTTADKVAQNAANFSAANAKSLAAANSQSGEVRDAEVNGTGEDKVDYGALLKADGVTDEQLKKLDQTVNKGVAAATPGGAARLANANRNRIEASLRGRLFQAERDKALSAAEVAEFTQRWNQLGAAGAARGLVEKDFFGLYRASLTVPAYTTRADIAPLIRQTHLNLLGFELPATADPAALCATAETLLAEVATAARAAAPAEAMPALYRAAAERARFPLLAGSLRPATRGSSWDYARTIEQLSESADLMERWNGSNRAAHTTRIKLPASLEAARSWPGWDELTAAAKSGRSIDLIHWLNELSPASAPRRSAAIQRRVSRYPRRSISFSSRRPRNAKPMNLLPHYRILLGLAFALFVLPAHAQKRKSSAPSSTPAPATAPTSSSTPAAKPEIALPLSPQSATAAAQILDQAKAAGVMLEQTNYGASIKASVSVHPLPPREAGHENYDDRSKNRIRTDYDWVQLRVIGDRYWLLGSEQLTVSAPHDPAKWSDVRWPNLGVPFVDVFTQDNRVWLMSNDWIAESTDDGSQLLSVPHLAPRSLSISRNLSQLSGGAMQRSVPASFKSAVVWGGKAWLGNREGAFFTFGDTLESVPPGRLGGSVSLHPDDQGLIAFGTPINGTESVVLRTADGKDWTSRPGLPEFAYGLDGKLAFGNHRYVRINMYDVDISADGIVWRRLPALLPDATLEVKQPDGSYAKQTRGVIWTKVIHEGGFFLALGEAYQPGRRHEKLSTADLAVAAVSDDGVSWTTIQLPVPSPSGGSWLAAGNNGTFLLTPCYGSKEVVVLRLSWDLFPVETNPANRHPVERSLVELKTTAEEAVKNRDIPKVARALLELEQFYPSEETVRISAALRAQLGDIDGAWQALVELERVVPADVEVALLRAQLLQAAGRAADAQAYARWFLAQKHNAPTGDAKTILAAKIARFNLMVGANRMEEALRFAETEALSDKTNVEFRLLLGMFHAQRGDFPQAKRWLGEAAALGDPRARQLLTQLPQQ